MRLGLLINLLSKFLLVSSSQMPKKFSELTLLMFSNLQGLVLGVLLLSQISYLECSFNDVDSVLSSLKELFFFLLNTSLIYFVSTSGTQLSCALLLSQEDYLLSCNYCNVFILSTQAPVLCCSPTL